MKNENGNDFDYSKLTVDKEGQGGIVYNDEYHKYWDKATQRPSISVTTLIHKFTTFDEDFWSKYKTLEALVSTDEFKTVKGELTKSKLFTDSHYTRFGIDTELFNEKRQEILAEWKRKRDESCIRGTAIHREHEMLHLAGQTKELQHLGLGGKFSTDVSNHIKLGEQGVYPELLMSRVSDDGVLRIAGQADLIIVDKKDVYVLDYKGLPLDTPVLTTSGFKLLETLTKEDIIFDKEGNETKILNISEIHNNPCYKIIFDNGEEIIADHEHRWLTSFSRGKGKFKDVVLTTEELKNALEIYKEKDCNTYHLPKILNAKPINTSERDLPIDPYILGSWLGDGTSVAGSITSINSSFWNEVEKRGYKYGEDISGDDRAEMRTIFGLRTELGKLNLLSNKHIPSIYLLSSYKQRLDLLRGFMDADGYYNLKRKRFVMATTREYQADYLISLLATLGIKPSKIYAKKYCNNKEFDGWDVCFTMSENPFLLRNQEGIELPKVDKASFRVIKSVELVETVPTKCLEVDSVSHTFLAGYTLLPTHNTNKAIEKKAFFDARTKKSSTMKYPLNHIPDVNFWHYQLQLSTYAWMIEKSNPELNIKALMIIHYDHDGGCTTYECDYLKKDVETMLSFYKKQLMNEEFRAKHEKMKF